MTKSNRGFFSNQGDVTLKLMIRSGQFSDSFKISSMATLSVIQENLIKTEGDMGEDKPFPIVSLRDLVVAKATKVFIEFP